MKMSTGEFFDRWTILRMKSRLDKDAKASYDLFDAEIKENLYEYSNIPELLCNVAQLAEANAKIWLTEAAIRKEYKDDPAAEGELSFEEIGRRALLIREYNKLRIDAKKAIDILFGDIPDNKVEHASQ